MPARLLDFRFRKLAHPRIARHLAGLLKVPFVVAIRLVEFDHRRDFGVFSRDLAVILHVGSRILVTQETVDFIETIRKLRQLGSNALLHVGVTGE